MAVERDQKGKIRRKSMCGTVLLAIGILAAGALLVTGSLWLVGAALIFLVPGLVLLYQVGKSLP